MLVSVTGSDWECWSSEVLRVKLQLRPDPVLHQETHAGVGPRKAVAHENLLLGLLGCNTTTTTTTLGNTGRVHGHQQVTMGFMQEAENAQLKLKSCRKPMFAVKSSCEFDPHECFSSVETQLQQINSFHVIYSLMIIMINCANGDAKFIPANCAGGE